MKKQVTKEEWHKFVEEYPKELHFSTVQFCEPPVHIAKMNDSQGWEGIVASITMYEVYPKGNEHYPYVWEPNQYYIEV